MKPHLLSGPVIGLVIVFCIASVHWAASEQSRSAPSALPTTQPTLPTTQRVSIPADVAIRSSEGRLRKQLFVVVSTARRNPTELKAVLPDHLAYLASLEASGELLMAGPLMNEDPDAWSGDGMLVYNASGIDRAQEIAAGDPMHSSGMRTYTIRPWLLNDGHLTLKVQLSNQRVQFP